MNWIKSDHALNRELCFRFKDYNLPVFLLSYVKIMASSVKKLYLDVFKVPYKFDRPVFL